MSSSSKNILLLVISLLVSVLICEVTLRTFVNIRDVGPTFSTYDPLLGKALKRDFSTIRYTPEFTMSMTTNSDGFRGPEIQDLGAESILFLGDSFTMGYGVNNGKEFPALIREQLRRHGDTTTVINAGMGGNGNGWWLNWLKQNAGKINPRHVVLQFYVNDLNDNVRERYYVTDEDNELIQLPIQAPGIQRRIQQVTETVPGLSNSHFVGFVRQVVHSISGFVNKGDSADHGNSPATVLSDEERRRPAQALQLKIIRDVMKLLVDMNCEVTVLLIDLSPYNIEALEEYLDSFDIETINIPGRMVLPDLYYVVDNHWNAKGHKHAASLLWEKLSNAQAGKKY